VLVIRADTTITHISLSISALRGGKGKCSYPFLNTVLRRMLKLQLTYLFNKLFSAAGPGNDIQQI